MLPSMKQAMLFAPVIAILLESSVKVLQLETLSLQINANCVKYLFEIQRFQHFIMCSTKAILFENLCLSDIVCGQSAITPVVMSEKRKRIVGGMEVVPNAWPWTVSLQTSSVGESQAQNNYYSCPVIFF